MRSKRSEAARAELEELEERLTGDREQAFKQGRALGAIGGVWEVWG